MIITVTDKTPSAYDILLYYSRIPMDIFLLIHTFKQVIRDMRSIWTAEKEASAVV